MGKGAEAPRKVKGVMVFSKWAIPMVARQAMTSATTHPKRVMTRLTNHILSLFSSSFLSVGVLEGPPWCLVSCWFASQPVDLVIYAVNCWVVFSGFCTGAGVVSEPADASTAEQCCLASGSIPEGRWATHRIKERDLEVFQREELEGPSKDISPFGSCFTWVLWQEALVTSAWDT